LMHGMIDRVIPIKFGRRLYAAANEPKEALWVPDAGHNDVYTPLTQKKVLNFLARIQDGALRWSPKAAAMSAAPATQAAH
ncbi:MAG TPA: alpha/beta hydrolase, partial [Alphaproteobacteria bacterium]|nr:alpha/beta hydrolase [Alphaproteobacteria bacterium]